MNLSLSNSLMNFMYCDVILCFYSISTIEIIWSSTGRLSLISVIEITGVLLILSAFFDINFVSENSLIKLQLRLDSGNWLKMCFICVNWYCFCEVFQFFYDIWFFMLRECFQFIFADFPRFVLIKAKRHRSAINIFENGIENMRIAFGFQWCIASPCILQNKDKKKILSLHIMCSFIVWLAEIDHFSPLEQVNIFMVAASEQIDENHVHAKSDSYSAHMNACDSS